MHRVFRESELAYCKLMRNPIPHYAVRFAAKEAVAKAFGCGIGEHLGLTDIEVTRGETGAPGIVLHGPGAQLAADVGVAGIFLTLSHTDNYAVANVVLTGGGS